MFPFLALCNDSTTNSLTTLVRRLREWFIFFITPKKNNTKKTREKWFNILNFFCFDSFSFCNVNTCSVSPFFLPLLLSDSEHCGYEIKEESKKKRCGRKFSNWFWSKMFMTMTMKVKLGESKRKFMSSNDFHSPLLKHLNSIGFFMSPIHIHNITRVTLQNASICKQFPFAKLHR